MKKLLLVVLLLSCSFLYAQSFPNNTLILITVFKSGLLELGQALTIG